MTTLSDKRWASDPRVVARYATEATAVRMAEFLRPGGCDVLYIPDARWPDAPWAVVLRA